MMWHQNGPTPRINVSSSNQANLEQRVQALEAIVQRFEAAQAPKLEGAFGSYEQLVEAYHKYTTHVDRELEKAGISYPTGGRGVADLRAMHESDETIIRNIVQWYDRRSAVMPEYLADELSDILTGDNP